MFKQPADVVLVREPGHRRYNAPKPISEISKSYWVYAYLCVHSYCAEWGEEQEDFALSSRVPLHAQTEKANQAAPPTREDVEGFLREKGWERWAEFPSAALRKKARRYGLFVEAWQKKQKVVVVFRGTEFTSLRDWYSNLRGFYWFVPFHRDQYTVVAEEVGRDFVSLLQQRKVGAAELVAVGHSLGGGLAQHFAYAFPRGEYVVKKVCAFNSSPVTGWFSAGQVKHENAKGLHIDRVFEHGEILAYLRHLLSYVLPPSAKNPSIKEVRFNVVAGVRPVRNHGMDRLAKALYEAANE